MRNRSCPSSISCWDYIISNCDDCAIGKLISKQKKKIARLKAENAALRNEADENAALSMENKMRADRLEAENAILRRKLYGEE